jgi:hypothetical protein
MMSWTDSKVGGSEYNRMGTSRVRKKMNRGQANNGCSCNITSVSKDEINEFIHLD